MSKCDNCDHKAICKWIETMNKYEEKVKDLKENSYLDKDMSSSPISLDVYCNSYKSSLSILSGGLNIKPCSMDVNTDCNKYEDINNDTHSHSVIWDREDGISFK